MSPSLPPSGPRAPHSRGAVRFSRPTGSPGSPKPTGPTGSTGSTARGALLACVGVLCACLLAGCSDTSFVGSRVDNVMAYYNTFYNANKSYDKGVEALTAREDPIDRDVYLSLFLEGGQGGTQDFEEAIDKSADVLRDHPNSRWVDDALLLIGKSYFFQQNYVGAEQKFREVAGLGSGKEGEARFWLTRTLVTAGRFAEAEEALSEGLGKEAGYSTWTARMRLVRGELQVQQGRWEAASQSLARGLDGDLPNDLAARSAFLLGQVRETLDRPREAAQAYERVLDANPPYELGYAARISAIRTRGLNGQAESALDRLRKMERDDKNFDKRAEMALVRGRLLQAAGDRDAARATLRGVLYGDATAGGSGQGTGGSAGGDVSGRTHYALAVLYRDAYDDFTTAAAHFDSAATALGAGPSTPRSAELARRLTPEAILDSRAQADRYASIADRSASLARMDSLLRLGRLSEEDFSAFVDRLREQRLEQMEAQQKAQADRANARRFASRGAGFQQQGASRGDETTAAATASEDAGFLFHRDPVRVQEGRRSFERRWGRRPRAPNWRRAAALSASEAPADSVVADVANDEAPAEAGREAVQVDVSDVPRDSARLAEMEARRAVARYELANALFLAAGRPDSAAVWYRTVIRENPDRTVARRALYALAEVQSAQGNADAARDLYVTLIDRYPESPFADRARQRLNRPPRAVGPDSTALADTAYAEAFATWQSGRLRQGFAAMEAVAVRHPSTPAAPRAVLAAASIYWRLARADTTAAPPGLDTLLQVVALPDTTAPDSTASDPTASDSTAGDTNGSDPIIRSDAESNVGSEAGDQARAAPRGRVPSPDAAAESPPPNESRTTDRAAMDSAAPHPAAMDSTRRKAATDSVVTNSVAGDSVATDSTGVPVAVIEPLIRLLEGLSTRYPDAPQAARADAMRASLQERLPSEGDPSASEPTPASADGGPSNRVTPSDDVRSDGAERSRVAVDDSIRAARARRTVTTWTIVAGTYATRADAGSASVRVRDAVGTGQAVRVEPSPSDAPEGAQHRVVVGRFPSRTDAQRAFERLADALPADARIDTARAN